MQPPPSFTAGGTHQRAAVSRQVSYTLDGTLDCKCCSTRGLLRRCIPRTSHCVDQRIPVSPSKPLRLRRLLRRRHLLTCLPCHPTLLLNVSPSVRWLLDDHDDEASWLQGALPPPHRLGLHRLQDSEHTDKSSTHARRCSFFLARSASSLHYCINKTRHEHGKKTRVLRQPSVAYTI